MGVWTTRTVPVGTELRYPPLVKADDQDAAAEDVYAFQDDEGEFYVIETPDDMEPVAFADSRGFVLHRVNESLARQNLMLKKEGDMHIVGRVTRTLPPNTELFTFYDDMYDRTYNLDADLEVCKDSITLDLIRRASNADAAQEDNSYDVKEEVEAESTSTPVPSPVPSGSAYIVLARDRHTRAAELYEQQTSVLWLHHDIHPTEDVPGFLAMSPERRHALMCVLTFFVHGDSMVNENIERQLEAHATGMRKLFLDVQKMIEGVHSLVYTDLLEAYAPSEAELQKRLDRKALDMPGVSAMCAWIEKWINNRPAATLAERLMAQSIVEGVFFSSPFAIIFFLKSQGELLSQLYDANMLISRDEGIHVKNYTNWYAEEKAAGRGMRRADVEVMVREALDAVFIFVRVALQVSLLGLAMDDMMTYVKSVANFVVTQADEEPVYAAREAYNPFDFMDNMNLVGNDDFFNKRPVEYKAVQFNTNSVIDFGDLSV